MNTADQRVFREHAKSCGLSVHHNQRYGEFSTAYVLAADPKCWLIDFTVIYNEPTVRIQWLIAGKLYNSKMKLDRFLKLSAFDFTHLGARVKAADERYTQLCKEMRTLTADFKRQLTEDLR